MKRFQIAVIGSAGFEEYAFEKPNDKMFEAAYELGYRLSKLNSVIITGGKGGVMESTCRGAKSAGGITIAEISGNERGASNTYNDIEVVTGDTAFRGPSQLVVMSDVIICIGGGAGTLQELCVAYRMQKPVILITGFGGWADKIAKLKYLDERRLMRFKSVQTVDDAVIQVKKVLKCVKL